MKTVRVTGKTIEDAVAEGLRQLGISRAEAVVHVVEEPSSGLFGLLRRKQAVVDVSAPEAEPEVPAAEAPEKKPEEAPAEETPAAETPAAAPEEKADTPAEPAEAAKAEPAAPEAVPAEAKPSEEEPVPAEESPEGKQPVQDEKEERPFSKEEQNATAEEAKKFLAGVFQGMGLSVTMEKMTNEERILLNLHGKGLGILIGKHGQTLNALQYLTNLAAGRLYRHRYFVLLDVENYRVRREQTLIALARRLAAKVKRNGDPVELEPMEPGERRVIHLALQDDPEIVTDSEGEGSARHVVIHLR